MRGARFAAAIVAVGLALGLGSAPARGDELSADEQTHLEQGITVSRTQTLDRGDRRYVGGVAYTIVGAPPEELGEVLDDVRAWRRILPETRDAHRVGQIAGDTLVEVTHGTPLIHVTYTLRVHRDGDTVRFWMDTSRPHDIGDVWGFFRTEPMDGPRTLVSYGILIDVGGGLLRELFESRARQLALTVPDRVRGLLLSRRIASPAPLLVAGAP